VPAGMGGGEAVTVAVGKPNGMRVGVGVKSSGTFPEQAERMTAKSERSANRGLGCTARDYTKVG
jgi:hypothetical protein